MPRPLRKTGCGAKKDIFVKAAQQQGWRSRAALKLQQLDSKLTLLRPGSRVLDLGGAPGSWSQVAAAVVGVTRAPAEAKKLGQVVLVDLLEVEEIRGVHAIQGYFTEEEVLREARAALRGGKADVVLCDAAPSASGDRGVDHLRGVALCEAALWASTVEDPLLAPGGHIVLKTSRGGEEGTLMDTMKGVFREVKFHKPQASRSDSREVYICGLHYTPSE